MTIENFNNSNLKSVSIGKLWSKSSDGTKPGSIRISQFLPGPLTLAPGSVILMYANNKRPGKADADFTLSIRLPEQKANELIEQMNANQASWKQAQKVQA